MPDDHDRDLVRLKGWGLRPEDHGRDLARLRGWGSGLKIMIEI